MRLVLPFLSSLVLVGASCGGSETAADPYTRFTTSYESEVVPAWNRWKHAAWRAHTQVVDGDARRAQEAVTARRDWLRKASNARWAREARELTVASATMPQAPSAAQEAGVEAVRVLARRNPSTDIDLLETRDLYDGSHLRLRLRTRPALDGAPIEQDELQRLYADATDIGERHELWMASTETSSRLKGSYLALRDVHNDIARKGGWTDHLSREIDSYRMDVDGLRDFLTEVSRDIQPLYRELHTWTRYAVATRAGAEPPSALPAHWLPTPLGRDWSGLVALEGADFDTALSQQGAPAMLRSVESLYTSFGLEPLPDTFWERSSLYPADASTGLGKTVGASAWDMNLSGDIRVLMSASATEHDWHQAIREFGFAHAFQERHRAALPVPVRQLQPRAMQGAVATWADLIASRPDHIEASGLMDDARHDMPALLREALVVIPWIRFMSSVVVPFEVQVYARELPENRVNETFWTLMDDGMGIVPPEPRSERYADALWYSPLHDLPGHTVDPLLATLIAYQLHVTLAERAGADPRTADFANNPSVGEAMRSLATTEGLRDWRMVVSDLTGTAPSAEALVRYFQPLQAWLEAQNAGRSATLDTP